MELIGHVRNGVVVLDGGATLPEGAEVRVLTNGNLTSKLPDSDKYAEASLLIHQMQEEEDLAKYGHFLQEAK